jgi:hypothetical protein
MNIDTDKNYSGATVVGLSSTVGESAAGSCPLGQSERRWVRQAIELKKRSKVQNRKNPRGALFIATNAQGLTRVFTGMASPIASTGRTIAAETVAVSAAGKGGYISDGLLVVTVRDAQTADSIDSECLIELGKFGGHAEVLFVGDSGRVLHTSLPVMVEMA